MISVRWFGLTSTAARGANVDRMMAALAATIEREIPTAPLSCKKFSSVQTAELPLCPHAFHGVEDFDMTLDDASALVFVGLERPDVALRCTAEDDAIVPRHHVNAEAARPLRLRCPRSALRVVVDLRLRDQHRQLPLQREQLAIAEEIARAETGAVDDDRLAQRQQIARRVELADHDVPAPQQELADQRVEVDVRLNADRRVADRVLRRERVLAGTVDLAARVESGHQARSLGRALLVLSRLIVGQREVVEP